MSKLIILSFVLLLSVSHVYAQGFGLSSKDIHGQLSLNQVYNGFGCQGKNISPQLEWKNPPASTKSYAITVYDPDAPTGSGWWHWVVFNIPATLTHLTSGADNLPQGSVQSITDFGQTGFGGACPPKGDRPHRYIFTVYALDVKKLDLDAKAAPALVGFVINKHALAKASVMAYYGR